MSTIFDARNLISFANPMRKCIGCGEMFVPSHGKQVRCKKDCGRTIGSRNNARAENRKNHVMQFVGVDGEGIDMINEEGRVEHHYVLLSVGDQSLYHDPPQPLTWIEIFEFLYEQFRNNRKACYVGFFLSYDFNMWLRTLPFGRADVLLSKKGIASRTRKLSGGNPTPFPVYLAVGDNDRAWEIDTLGFRKMKIRPGSPVGTVNTNPWMHICDSASYFQMAFLNVLKDKKGNLFPGVEEWEYELVRQGKEKRSGATAITPEMIRYNILENDLLSRVMTKMNEGFRAEGIKISPENFYGPGQATQAWMNNIKMHTREAIEAAVPVWAREAAQASYYGGWFEIFRHGTIPGVTYEYDINSAYPAEMCTLPCLLHGEWRQGTGQAPRNGLVLLYGTSSGTDAFAGGLPHRTAKGNILRPHSTKGWYWQLEVEASTRAGLISEFKCDEWVQYIPCDCEPPLAPMRELYLKRTTIPEGKDSPRGIALKLVYNSAYGKLAQSIGSPKYANAFYASLITSGTRIRILDAIATHPRRTGDLLMVATDGVYFRTPHPTIPLSPTTLGEWGAEEKENITLFLPGLYWDDASRERVRSGGKPKIKSRGVPAAGLAQVIDSLDRQYAEFDGVTWPEERVHIPFTIVSATQALARGNWNLCGWTGEAWKDVKGDPTTKRQPVAYQLDGIWTSRPYAQGEELETHPYEKSFGATPGDVETEDGPVMTMIISALHKTSAEGMMEE